MHLEFDELRDLLMVMESENALSIMQGDQIGLQVLDIAKEVEAIDVNDADPDSIRNLKTQVLKLTDCVVSLIASHHRTLVRSNETIPIFWQEITCMEWPPE